MQKIQQFLKGKKTYLSALVIALAACVGWWIHVVGYTEALSLLGIAGGMAGLGAKSERYGAAVLAVLGKIQQAQATVPAGQKIDTRQLAADLGKAVLSNFAQGGLVRSTPAGAVSNVFVPDAGQTCIFCGLSINANGGVCDSPRNDSAAMSSGNRAHVYLAANGGAAK